MAFQPIPLSIFIETLEPHGFKRFVVGSEVVYDREINSELRLRIYTSVKDGELSCRPRGDDAIRAILLYRDRYGQDYGVKRGDRVNRTGTPEQVIQRLRERCVILWKLGRAIQKQGVHAECGHLTYPDRTRCVVYKCRNKSRML